MKKGGEKGIRKGEEDQGWGDKTWGIGLCHFACLIRSAVFFIWTISEIIFFYMTVRCP